MKKVVNTNNAPKPVGPYSQAIQAGPWLILSGQIAIDPSTNELITDDVKKQTHQVMKNLSAVLSEAGYSFSDVVRAGIFLENMDDFAQVNEVYASYLSEPYPTRATVAVKQLPKAVQVEIDMLAYKL